MNDEINYKSNPLHGLSLKNLLTEVVDHYGFEILFAYLNLNCFKNNPSIDASVKFLKKTDWAREKVESFYLYEFKNLPRASNEQFELSPRDRVIPEGQTPGEPKELDLEDAARLQEKRAKKAAMRDSRPQSNNRNTTNRGNTGRNSGYQDDTRKDKPQNASDNDSQDDDPWAKWR